MPRTMRLVCIDGSHCESAELEPRVWSCADGGHWTGLGERTHAGDIHGGVAGRSTRSALANNAKTTAHMQAAVVQNESMSLLVDIGLQMPLGLNQLQQSIYFSR